MDLEHPLEVGGDGLQLHAEAAVAGDGEAVLPHHRHHGAPVVLEDLQKEGETRNGSDGGRTERKRARVLREEEGNQGGRGLRFRRALTDMAGRRRGRRRREETAGAGLLRFGSGDGKGSGEEVLCCTGRVRGFVCTGPGVSV